MKDTKENPSVPFLIGKKIILRPLVEKDINKKYLCWINDREVTKYMETGVFPTTLKELNDYYNRIKNSKTDVIFAICDKKTKKHIGNIKLGGINWIHRFANLGIMIGDKNYWGRGYGQEACKLLLEYAFKRLNINKITLGVYSNHKRAIKTYKKVGFVIEGRIKGIFYIDGKFLDHIIMGIAQKEYIKKYGNF
ncbi:MAG: GNAT family N-acetyltransferase [Candidatus Omnitrophica bacterium]|nr:GNAT family N-acetyltransferase [Candidatus Omnitrophota bacterium]